MPEAAGKFAEKRALEFAANSGSEAGIAEKVTCKK
jgi:hypothetical protein